MQTNVQYWAYLQQMLRDHYIYDHEFYDEVINLIRPTIKPNIDLVHNIMTELERQRLEQEYLSVKPILDEEKYYEDLHAEKMTFPDSEGDESDYF